MPGGVLGGWNRGAHALLKDGAKVVEDVDDTMEELLISQVQGNPAVADDLEDEALLSRLARGESYGVDEPVAISGVENSALLARLFDLELSGRVEWLAGGPFMRVGS